MKLLLLRQELLRVGGSLSSRTSWIYHIERVRIAGARGWRRVCGTVHGLRL